MVVGDLQIGYRKVHGLNHLGDVFSIKGWVVDSCGSANEHLITVSWVIFWGLIISLDISWL